MKGRKVWKNRGLLISPNSLLISLRCQKHVDNSVTWKEKTNSKFHKILLTISPSLKKMKKKEILEKENNLKAMSRTF